MNAELIAVGSELLMGQIANTNGQYLSAELSSHGINVHFHTVAGDNYERLKSVLSAAFKRADCVILTGGLGPTYDDITKEAVADYFILPLVDDEDAIKTLSQYFEKRGRKMAPSNLKQARIIKGASFLPNDVGTAPGILLERDGKIAALLPGPPSEMKAMFDNYLAPFLYEKSGVCVYSEVLHLFGIGESEAESEIQDLTASENPTVAPYVKSGELTLRISARAENEDTAKKMISPVKEKIYNKLGSYIYGEGADCSLPLCAFNLMKDNSLTLSVAESCTGGMVSAAITDLSGASDVFMYGAVTYANSAKEKAISVSHDTLLKHGAVSEQTALEMARGVRKAGNTDIGVSTTGIAGPTGGTPDKPVGTVYIAISTPKYEKALRLYIPGQRDRVREVTVLHVYNLIRRTILENNF